MSTTVRPAVAGEDQRSDQPRADFELRAGVALRADAWQYSEGARRALNIAVAAVAIILTLPLMVAVAVLVKLTSPGPVLYSQTRVGVDRRRSAAGRLGPTRRNGDLGGRPFKIYKFRTMAHEPANGDRETWASPDDPRVTPVGRLLRKYRIDELPQLFNVLKADMNVVGPRPEQPTIFRDLRQQIDHYELRQGVLPGITGLAQVSQPYDRSTDDVRRKVGFDLEYVRRRSVGEDVRIMLRTFPVIVFKRGAW